VAVDFGPEHGTCHGKVLACFGREGHCHVARADGEEADLNAGECTSAVELARTTVGSARAPMEHAPLHQHRVGTRGQVPNLVLGHLTTKSRSVSAKSNPI
jgi:hypothetical protein